MFGPVNGSRHDSAVFSRSQLESSCKALCTGPQTYQLYSDSAYPASSILLKGFKNTTDRGKLAFNKQMSSLRISVEWAFGYIGKKFPLVLNAKHNRMQQTSIAAEMYATVIVSNAISCLEPNQISQYFRCAPPAVEDYLHDNLPRTPEEYLDASSRCLASDIDRQLWSECEKLVNKFDEQGAPTGAGFGSSIELTS
jgi:nuclease HARBI1